MSHFVSRLYKDFRFHFETFKLTNCHHVSELLRESFPLQDLLTLPINEECKFCSCQIKKNVAVLQCSSYSVLIETSHKMEEKLKGFEKDKFQLHFLIEYLSNFYIF